MYLRISTPNDQYEAVSGRERKREEGKIVRTPRKNNR